MAVIVGGVIMRTGASNLGASGSGSGVVVGGLSSGSAAGLGSTGLESSVGRGIATFSLSV